MKLYLLVNYGQQNGEKLLSLILGRGILIYLCLQIVRPYTCIMNSLILITDRQYLEFRANIFIYFFYKTWMNCLTENLHRFGSFIFKFFFRYKCAT